MNCLAQKRAAFSYVEGNLCVAQYAGVKRAIGFDEVCIIILQSQPRTCAGNLHAWCSKQRTARWSELFSPTIELLNDIHVGLYSYHEKLNAQLQRHSIYVSASKR